MPVSEARLRIRLGNMVRIGAHLHDGDPLAEALAMGAEAVQFFLGDPQGWKAPTFPGDGDPAEIRSAFADAGVDAYIHSPYGINVASPNNRIRIPSRKLLAQQLQAAAAIGAKGLIVHGGHVTAGVDPREGYDSWRKAIEPIARLWDAVTAGLGDGGEVGFCLDTCHANAAGEDLVDVVDRIKAITGRIDLVHCNNSRDEFGSGRDRHAGLTSGTIDPARILGVVRAAGAPVICETPDPGADIRWLRGQLSS